MRRRTPASGQIGWIDVIALDGLCIAGDPGCNDPAGHAAAGAHVVFPDVQCPVQAGLFAGGQFIRENDLLAVVRSLGVGDIGPCLRECPT